MQSSIPTAENAPAGDMAEADTIGAEEMNMDAAVGADIIRALTVAVIRAVIAKEAAILNPMTKVIVFLLHQRAITKVTSRMAG